MKKIIIISAAFVFIATAASAQMGGMMGGSGKNMEHDTAMEGGHHEMGGGMMQDMSGMMHEIMGMMQMMSQSMEHRTVTEHMKMADMAKVMEEMSATMHDMAGHMAKGSMGPEAMKQMKDRVGMMHKMMKGIEGAK